MTPGKGIADLDSGPIVGDLQQLQAAVLDHDFQRSRSRVHGIFDELLQSMHWRDDDLSCRNLVHDAWIQSLSSIH